MNLPSKFINAARVLAGVAVEDVTPPVGYRMAGYSRNGVSIGTLDRLELSALSLAARDFVFTIVSLDNVGLYVSEADEIRLAISAAAQIPVQQIMLHCTHTHSGPAVDQEYLEALKASAVQAARRSIERMQPVSLGWGGCLADANINRRFDGTSKSRSGKPIVDPRVGVLRIDDERGRLFAVLIRYSAHGTVLKADNLRFSADWPGAVRRSIAAATQCPVMVLNGCAGDTNPRWRGSVDDLQRMSDAISIPVFDCLPGIVTHSSAALGAVSTNIDVDLKDVPEPAAALRLAREAEEQWEVDTQEWRTEVASRWARGEVKAKLEVGLQVVRIADGCLAGLPMEPFTALALRFAEDSVIKPAFLNGYTNGWLGYLPSAEDIRAGGYEIDWAPVSHGVPTGWIMPVNNETGGRVVSIGLDLVRELHPAEG